MARPINPSVPKRQLGLALAGLREAAGKSREDAAGVVECSESKISRIERGHVGVRASELRDLLNFYGVTGQQRTELEELARGTRRRRPRTTYGKALPDWFRRYVNLEEAASEIRTYDGELVTGILQTENYARAITRASPLHRPEDVDRLVQARIARQARLTSDNPPQMWVVMAEGVLRTRVGGREIMRAQLDHILEVGHLPNVTIQVTPFSSGAHASSGINFSLLRFPDEVGVDVVYLEDLTSASYLDKPDDPQRQQYVLVFNHLTAGALSPTESLELVDTVKQEL